jgi:hypothetical protein
MPGRLGPRFAIEALFLIALAVGVAYADLASKWIVLVMAGGWLVVALLELSADRIWAAAPPWRRPYYVPASPPRAEAVVATPAPSAIEPEPEAQPEPAELEPDPELEPEPAPKQEPEFQPEPDLEPAAKQEAEKPEPEPEPEPVSAAEPEAVTMIAPRAEPAAPAPPGPEPEEPDTAEDALPTLEPLEPRRKRGWFRRRERDVAELETPEVELPKHVRLLPPAERTDRPPNEVAELFDLPEPEERSRP